ncbi:hypothetical protein K9M79_02540 [Candidatus Woesearchaeota archaeon]|nr:hypothetical protein [Candidatus Woesearchaeota archaeon]
MLDYAPPPDISKAITYDKQRNPPLVEVVSSMSNPLSELEKKIGSTIYLAQNDNVVSDAGYGLVGSEYNKIIDGLDVGLVHRLNDDGKYSQVIDKLKEPISIFKKFDYSLLNQGRKEKLSKAFNSYGYAIRQSISMEDSKKYFNTAIDLDPNNSAPYGNLGFIMVKEKKYAEALRLYQTAKELNNDPVFKKKVQKWINKLKTMI